MVLRGFREGEMQVAHMRAEAVADQVGVAYCALPTSTQQGTHLEVKGSKPLRPCTPINVLV